MRLVALMSVYLASLCCQNAYSVESISLSLVAPDLSALPVGSPVTIGVELAGLSPGASLDSLAATVTFDGSLLGTPTLHAGLIVPNPLADPLDLLSTADTGLADMAFLTFGLNANQHIEGNGVFFSFDVTAAQVGSGAFRIGFAGATQFNASNPNAPLAANVLASADLPFNVVAVPEPAAAALCWLFASAALFRRRTG